MPVFSRWWTNPQTNLPDAAQLRVNGPALQVEVRVPSALAAALQRRRLPVPPPQVGLALIDTGASITAVEGAVLQTLGLSPTGFAPIATPGGTVQQPVYACDMEFPGTPIPVVPFNFVIGSQVAGLGYAALIGRDVLTHFQLVYNGVEGLWTLAF